MKEFGPNKFLAAIAHSKAGGQALLIRFGMRGFKGAPRGMCDGPVQGFLYDKDEDRLRETVEDLGVKRVIISRLGQDSQLVLLWGKPLELAMAEAKKGD